MQGTSTEGLYGKTKKEIDSIVQKRGIALTQEEKHGGTIFQHCVQFKIKLDDFTARQLMQPLFYRTQSLAFSETLNKVYESHVISGKITVVDAGLYAVEKVINCARIGISALRGLALTQDNKFLVITDRWQNVYFFDTEAERIVEEMTFV